MESGTVQTYWTALGRCLLRRSKYENSGFINKEFTLEKRETALAHVSVILLSWAWLSVPASHFPPL